MPKTVHAQAKVAEKYTINLRPEKFTPKPGIAGALKESLSQQLKRGRQRHVLVQIERHLDKKERATLEEEGIRLLSYVGSYTWYATLTDRRALEFTVPETVSQTPILGNIRWIGEIKSSDRVTPEILEPESAKWIKIEDNRERYSVYFFKDVPMDNARKLITSLGGQIEGKQVLMQALYVVLPSGALNSLMNQDIVQLIDFYPVSTVDHNNGSRAWCHTDQVHTAPAPLTNLDGNDVVLGLWESGGHPQNQHIDLTVGRCHLEDVAADHWHATHVCGTIIGTGAGSAARMGHAPGVNDIHCYRVDNVGPADEVADGFHDFNLVAVNNSWGYRTGWEEQIATNTWFFEASVAAGDPFNAGPQTRFGDYRDPCQGYDQLVCDSSFVIVFSAGNDRDDPDDGSQTAAEPGDWDQIAGAGSWDGYHTLHYPSTAKNGITVGAIDDNTNAMSVLSNWGPTDDGRIKPDIVAPGIGIVSCHNEDVDVDGTFDDYVGANGTSAAAPAVTGIVALLVQSYREDYLGATGLTETPYPSTIKAILCQSAQDMGDVGPDYQFGYGGVRADAARQIIVDERFREGVIASMDDKDVYEFTVAAGDPEIRVTLAWDDRENVLVNPDPVLINDLDLVIEDPAGNYYTPWHLYITAHDQVVNAATRNSHAVASTDLIPEADRDRWNNVEQVYIDPALTGAPLQAGTWKVIVEPHDLPEPTQKYSLAANYVIEEVVEVVQVLDNSGSMSGSATPLPGSDSKIEALRDAANLAVDIMDADVGHKLGLVKFSTNATTIMDLQSFTTDARDTAHSKINALTATYSTSIGDGLMNAFTEFTTSGDVDNRQVIILMTDGKGNSALGVSDLWLDPAWANSQAIIYTLGLGHDGGIWSDTLAWLADSTGGDYRQTTDPIELTKFFIEALASAVDWGPATDPTEELAPGGKKSFPVVVTEYDRSVTFTVYWSGIDDAIDLKIYDANGNLVSVSAPEVRRANGNRYIIYNVERTSSNWIGEWNMEVESTVSDTVTYSTSSLVESSLKLEAGFDKIYSQTGDRIRTWARVASPTLPLPPPKAEITAYCNRPLEGVGNVLHSFKYDPNKLTSDAKDYDPVTAKLEILSKQTGKEILPRITNTLVLYDDGAHEDGAAGDGLYANTFTDTKVQGSYTFRFVASNITSGSGVQTTREWTKSFYNEVNIDPDHSTIDVGLLAKTADGNLYKVTVAPKDKFGNYIGAGHPVAVTITYPGGSRQIQLDDNIDGTYTKEILITQDELKADPKLKIDVDGKEFTTASIERKRKFSISAHGGFTSPLDPLSNNYDMSYNFLFDIDYHLSEKLALIGLFGYNNFKGDSASVDDTHFLNLSLNVRSYTPLMQNMSLYIGGGPGIYIDENGNTKSGVNAGLGLNYQLIPSIALEIGADYHNIINPDIQFIQSHAGVVVRF
jgi:hypothetical protein